jgi:hypothetical protein
LAHFFIEHGLNNQHRRVSAGGNYQAERQEGVKTDPLRASSCQITGTTTLSTFPNGRKELSA